MKLCKGSQRPEYKEMQGTSRASMFITCDGTMFVVRDKQLKAKTLQPLGPETIRERTPLQPYVGIPMPRRYLLEHKVKKSASITSTSDVEQYEEFWFSGSLGRHLSRAEKKCVAQRLLTYAISAAGPRRIGPPSLHHCTWHSLSDHHVGCHNLGYLRRW